MKVQKRHEAFCANFGMHASAILGSQSMRCHSVSHSRSPLKRDARLVDTYLTTCMTSVEWNILLISTRKSLQNGI